jgi:hypothetical protein
MRPMRSPSEIVKETFSKSGFAPKAFEIPCALIIGGNDLQSPERVLFEIIRNCERGGGAQFMRASFNRYADFSTCQLKSRSSLLCLVAHSVLGLRIEELSPDLPEGLSDTGGVVVKSKNFVVKTANMGFLRTQLQKYFIARMGHCSAITVRVESQRVWLLRITVARIIP